MIDVIGELSRVPPMTAYVVVAVVILAESILLVGAFMPTFSLLVASGALAALGQLDVVVLIGVASISVIAGDYVGHRTGRAMGVSPLARKLMTKLPVATVTRAEQALARHGGWAVLGGRFVPVLRTVTPHLAGINHVPYHSIAVFSIAAAIVWAAAEVSLGYFAAGSLGALTQYGAPVMACVAAAVAVFIALIVWTRRTRTGARELAAPATPSDLEPLR